MAETTPLRRAPAPADGGPLAALEGVGVSRDGRWLIHDIDLEVRAGEIVSLIGPNGGGKTTLLRVVLGLIAADAGSVARRPGLSIGYVPQRVAIDPVLPLTVARLMTLTMRRPRAEVAAALADTGVEAVIDQPVQSLSGGELQRVLLARALLRAPDLLVLDEPVQGVDYAGEAALYALIAGIRDRFGCGVLLVSHDLHMVMAETDRVVCLNHHVCCTGAPNDVTRHAEYRRLFGPRAAAAFAVYRHRHDHEHDLAGEVVEQGEAAAREHPHQH
jgi:zinc transport system ATP-binding protein